MGALPWQEALDITRQLLDALHCLHQQSFVHCDVTPENILFGDGGFCKLADFSQARPMDPAHNAESGAVVGNPRYISPEQVKGERALDQRSDLYSLGVVLYEMLCGRPPFESRSQFELMMAHVHQAPAPPSSVKSKVPQSLDAVVLKALAKDPADRYPSAPAFSDAIAGFHAEVAQADASPVTESWPGIEPEPTTRQQFEPAEEVAESPVLELESAGEPAVVEAAAPTVEVGASAEPALEAAPESVPQSEVIAEADSVPAQAIVTDIHVEAELAAEVVPELEAAAESAIAETAAVDAAQETASEIVVSSVAEAGVVAQELIVPTVEAAVETVEAVAVAEEVIVPTPEAVVETVEAVAVAEEEIVPTPEAVVETVEAATVAEEVIVPAPVEVVETVEAAAVAEEVIVPTPEAVVETVKPRPQSSQRK